MPQFRGRNSGCSMLLTVPRISILCQLLILIFSSTIASPCFALDPDPRRWAHLPADANFGGFAYVHTQADIFFDPTFSLEDVEMKLDTVAGKYIRTFEIFNKSTRIDITQAYQEGKWTGLLEGNPAATSRSGLSDTFIRVAINLLGAPPLRGKKFGAYRANTDIETIVGVGLVVRLPTGNYMEDKLINLGQNRFAFRPQFGIMHTRGSWSTELTGEVAFYTKNDEFFNGNTLEQHPLYVIHGHLIHTIAPGHWVSFSLGYDYGGEYTVNGIDKNDTKQDVGLKLSYAYPINRASGLKLSYIGTRTKETTGFDSETLALSLSLLW